jgi:oxygen-independent coproporphyrinogen-3 oxidase
MIYGLPGQSLSGWLADLRRALALGSEHLSAYALSLEEGTPLERAVSRGALPRPDDDLQADMYEATEETLAAAGYQHYEISNWARPLPQPLPEAGRGTPPCRGREGGLGGTCSSAWGVRSLTCQHNLIYWRNEPYVGLGTAAHSFLGGQRFARIADPAAYVAAAPAARVAYRETIARPLEMAETAMLGLRLVAGLARSRFRGRFGVEPLEAYREPLLWAEGMGLLELVGDCLRLTRRGRLLSNEVFQCLLPDD